MCVSPGASGGGGSVPVATGTGGPRGGRGDGGSARFAGASGGGGAVPVATGTGGPRGGRGGGDPARFAGASGGGEQYL